MHRHVIAVSTQSDVSRLATLYHRFIVAIRRKLEEWPEDGDPKKLTMEVKLGEEQFLEELIRFCYSKQITFTEGEQLAFCSVAFMEHTQPVCH